MCQLGNQKKGESEVPHEKRSKTTIKWSIIFDQTSIMAIWAPASGAYNQYSSTGLQAQENFHLGFKTM